MYALYEISLRYIGLIIDYVTITTTIVLIIIVAYSCGNSPLKLHNYYSKVKGGCGLDSIQYRVQSIVVMV